MSASGPASATAGSGFGAKILLKNSCATRGLPLCKERIEGLLAVAGKT